VGQLRISKPLAQFNPAAVGIKVTVEVLKVKFNDAWRKYFLTFVKLKPKTSGF
jgi:hypothetical protein